MCTNTYIKSGCFSFNFVDYVKPNKLARIFDYLPNKGHTARMNEIWRNKVIQNREKNEKTHIVLSSA